jgi:hypothetical protein
MPSRLHSMPGRLTDTERDRLTKEADEAGVPLGTYVRGKLGLPPLARGGARSSAGRPAKGRKKTE